MYVIYASFEMTVCKNILAFDGFSLKNQIFGLKKS